MGIPIIMSLSSSMGPGGLASLQSGLQMLGRLGNAVKDTIKDLDKFAQVHKNLAGPIGEADAATKGLIDTMAMMVGRNKIAAAGYKATGKEFRNLSVLAAKHSQVMGTDATAEFNKLISAIAKGRVTTLKEYGIDIRNVTKLTDIQSAAFKAMGEKAEGMTVDIGNTTQGLYALNNSWGTFLGTLWEGTTFGKETTYFLNKVTNALNRMIESIRIARGELTDKEKEIYTPAEQYEIHMQRYRKEHLNYLKKKDFWDKAEVLRQAQLAAAAKGKVLPVSPEDVKLLGKTGSRPTAPEKPFLSQEVAKALEAKDIAFMEGDSGELPQSVQEGKVSKANLQWMINQRKKTGGGGGGKRETIAPKTRPTAEEAFVATAEEQARMDTIDMSLEGPTMMGMENNEILRNMGLRRQRHDIQEELDNRALNNEISRIGILTGARIDADESAIMGQKALASATNLAGDAATAGIQALINGGKGFKAAVWGMISQRLAGFASEETILAARDFAAAASAGASIVGLPLVPGLMGSAGMHLAVAAAAGAGAVGAGVRAKSLKPKASKPSAPSVGSGGMVYGGGPSGGPAKLDSGGGSPTYNIVLRGEVADVFEVIADENETRRRSGQRGFSERTD